MPARTPVVRVEDARLVPDGGPARLVVTGLEDPQRVADALDAERGRAEVVGGRLRVVGGPAAIAAAVPAAGEPAGTVEHVLTGAVEAWLSPAPDLPTAVGSLSGCPPAVMGIVNVTPDSFSDGGDYFDPDDPGPAIAHARRLAEAGADVLDVGGESTRPGADPVPVDVECDRVLPVVAALVEDGVCVSIDTSKAAVAREAVAAGAAIVNDVTAGRGDEDMAATVAGSDVAYIAMHMLGTPRTMQDDPRYDDVVAEVFEFLAERVARLTAAGIDRDRLVVDPGIGFGKTVRHNLLLLRHLRELTSLGRPVLVGASRKSFLGAVSRIEDARRRVPESLAAACAAVAGGASIIRVHDVEQTVRAARVAGAITRGHGGEGGS